MTEGINNNKISWNQKVSNFLQNDKVITIAAVISMIALAYFGYHHEYGLLFGVGGSAMLLAAIGIHLRMRSDVNANDAALETTVPEKKTPVHMKGFKDEQFNSKLNEATYWVPLSVANCHKNQFSGHLIEVYAGFSKLNKT